MQRAQILVLWTIPSVFLSHETIYLHSFITQIFSVTTLSQALSIFMG